jgi:hypothetical protein
VTGVCLLTVCLSDGSAVAIARAVVQARVQAWTRDTCAGVGQGAGMMTVVQSRCYAQTGAVCLLSLAGLAGGSLGSQFYSDTLCLSAETPDWYCGRLGEDSGWQVQQSV